jgi:hypothetical protein
MIEKIIYATGIVTWILIFLLMIIGLWLIGLAIWIRFWSKVTNLFWYGYDIKGEHPPKWRKEAAIYAYALRERDFSAVSKQREWLDKLEQQKEEK